MVLDWRKGDIEGLGEEPKNIDFDDIFQDKTVNSAWVAFKDQNEDTINRYIPLALRRKKGDPQWLSCAVKRLINRKQKCWKRFSKNIRIDDNFEKFITAEKLLICSGQLADCQSDPHLPEGDKGGPGQLPTPHQRPMQSHSILCRCLWTIWTAMPSSRTASMASCVGSPAPTTCCSSWRPLQTSRNVGMPWTLSSLISPRHSTRSHTANCWKNSRPT